jgi:serine phosphatase RsbU (regulator of sigma subunit)
VRYVPAPRLARVGGDWYDAFIAAGRLDRPAIGDVVGHDTRPPPRWDRSAGLLRGIAFTTGASPAAVLTRLDHGVVQLLPDTTVTSVVAKVEAAVAPTRRAQP